MYIKFLIQLSRGTENRIIAEYHRSVTSYRQNKS